MFPASRLLISTVTAELTDLSRGYASFKRLVEGDPNLRPKPPEPSPKSVAGALPSPSFFARTISASSTSGCGGSVGGGDSEGTGGESSSPGSIRSEKLATLSRQRTENRKSTAPTGKVGGGFVGAGGLGVGDTFVGGGRKQWRSWGWSGGGIVGLCHTWLFVCVGGCRIDWLIE